MPFRLHPRPPWLILLGAAYAVGGVWNVVFSLHTLVFIFLPAEGDLWALRLVPVYGFWAYSLIAGLCAAVGGVAFLSRREWGRKALGGVTWSFGVLCALAVAVMVPYAAFTGQWIGLLPLSLSGVVLALLVRLLLRGIDSDAARRSTAPPEALTG